VRVELANRAQRSIERLDARWRRQADHPDIFREELDRLITHLETVSNPGTPCATARRPGLKRMLLERTSCHVYFVVDVAQQRIDVLDLWDARRERSPKL
jgi:hypothetical protein